MDYPLNRRTLLTGILSTAAVGHQASAAESDVMTGPLKDWRSHMKNAHLVPAFEYLERTDLSTMPVGKHPVDGDRMYLTVTEAMSRPIEGQKFETHRKYIDVHVLIAGAETIGSAKASDLKVVTPYDGEKEIEMFALPGTFRRIRMMPGQFAVFLPGQAHLPGCHEQTPVKIRKAVMKVMV